MGQYAERVLQAVAGGKSQCERPGAQHTKVEQRYIVEAKTWWSESNKQCWYPETLSGGTNRHTDNAMIEGRNAEDHSAGATVLWRFLRLTAGNQQTAHIRKQQLDHTADARRENPVESYRRG
jgi:hypothetical protein